jgi:hypothetical protein
MSGGIDFDPSREWLGIAAIDLGDPVRALGLTGDVSDPAIVTAAATRLLDRLRGIDPGPFKLAHEALVQRIETSRDELLAIIAARSPRVVPPPPPTEDAASILGSAVAAPPGSPPLVVPAATNDGSSAEPPAHAPAQAAEPEVIVVRRSAPVRRAQPSVMPALLSLLALMLVGVAVYRFWPRPAGQRSPRDEPRVAVLPRPPRPPTSDVTDPRPPIAVSPVPAPPILPPAASPPAPPSGGAAPAPASPSQPPATPPSPPPPPAPPEPDPQARARAAELVADALRAAYDAIRADDFNTADRQVATAARLAAQDDALTQRVTCWRQFARYARQAAGFREQALDAANAGGDFDVGNKRIAVIESTRERFVYRREGRNVAFTPRSAAPDPVVTAILRTWFAAADKPGNHVFLGTHLVARREPNLRLAAAAWERAREGGEDVSLLVPLLTDAVIRAVATE